MKYEDYKKAIADAWQPLKKPIVHVEMKERLEAEAKMAELEIKHPDLADKYYKELFDLGY